MIYRLFAKIPDEGWVLVCTVDAPDAQTAMREARSLKNPRHLGKPLKLVPENEPPPTASSQQGDAPTK